MTWIVAKQPKTPPPDQFEIDERWMAEWIKYGLKAIEDSLDRHAAFDQYCRRKEEWNAEPETSP